VGLPGGSSGHERKAVVIERDRRPHAVTPNEEPGDRGREAGAFRRRKDYPSNLRNDGGPGEVFAA
jgi:hypothetical protein